MRSGFFLSKAPKSACCLLLVCTLALFSGTPAAQAASAKSEISRLPSLAGLANEVKHAVVNISTTQVAVKDREAPFGGPDSPLRDFFGEDFYKKFFEEMPQQGIETQALGSGFIIDQSGLILTNNHVVEKAEEIMVRLENGKEYEASVVGRDPKTDLALIQVQVDGADFPKAVTLGNSDALQVGDWVMAVGNPFGLGQTVTVGIISGKGRVIGAGPYDEFLQTDAAINLGNSGGPLYDMDGKVIGINTAIVAQGQGIGFAIPINVARQLIPQLKTGKVVRGWLGAMIQDLSPALAKSFGLKDAKGALIADVLSDSPAAKAGIMQGDVITRFNGKEIEAATDLSRLAAAAEPGTQVKVEFIREGAPQTTTMTIGTMPEEEQPVAPVEAESPWGVTVQDLTPDLAQRLGLAENEKGIIISGVEPGSPAAEAGLQAGDLIREVNRQPIASLSDYEKAMEKVREDENVLFLLKRGERTFYMVLQQNPGSDE